MTADPDRRGWWRFKLSLLFACPLLVAVGLGLADRSAHAPDETTRRVLGAKLEAAFASLLGEVATIADEALASSPERAWTAARRRSRVFERRLEGIALVGPDGAFLTWAGTPAEPPAGPAGLQHADWSVRIDGVRTRLWTRAGPDAQGRHALVCLLIDSTLDDLGFRKLLPRDLRGDGRIEVSFGPHGKSSASYAGRLSLRSPAGDVLATAEVVPASPATRARRATLAAQAWGIALFLALAAFLFDWRSICGRRGGLLLVLALLVAARGILIWRHVPGHLLPRELSSASLFGSSRLWGLLASPADLLLTGALIFAACLAVRVHGAERGPGLLTRVLFALGATGASLAAAVVAVSLARNSRVSLLERPAPFEWDSRLVLWLGLLLVIAGAASLWAWLWRPAARTPPMRVAIVSVLLAMGASALLQQQSERLAAEQLASEYAPQVLDQAARRRLSLMTAMQQIVDAEGRKDARPEFLAYRHWVGSELFHSRYKSSLDFYTPDGRPIDHFGFGLPPLDDHIESFDDTSRTGEIREEWIDSMAVQPRLLHTEALLRRGDEVVGVVVGHVLDEPDNLPFLPWARTYLAALGPGNPRGGAVAAGGELQYVLYDARGNVSLTTTPQPPAETERLRAAAATGRPLGVDAGDEPYMALALEETDGRLHLLLLPKRTRASRPRRARAATGRAMPRPDARSRTSSRPPAADVANWPSPWSPASPVPSANAS